MTVQETYDGSDGDATRALYASLASLGPVGIVALNLFRAAKNSARAKKYRGGLPGKGSYRSMAYDRKAYAISCLCDTLTEHAAALQISWGWQHDPATPGFEWVLYVEVPGFGQASYHAPGRGKGPDYPGRWDGIHATPVRVIYWCEQLLLNPPAPSTTPEVGACTTRFCQNCGVWWPPQRQCPSCQQGLISKEPPARRDEVRPGVAAEWS